MGPKPLNHLAPNPHYLSPHQVLQYQSPPLPSFLFPFSTIPLQLPSSWPYSPHLQPPSIPQSRPAVSYLRWSLQWLMQEGGWDPALPSLRPIWNLLCWGLSAAILVSFHRCLCICIAVIYSWNHVTIRWQSSVKYGETPYAVASLFQVFSGDKSIMGYCELIAGCKLSHSITFRKICIAISHCNQLACIMYYNNGF